MKHIFEILQLVAVLSGFVGFIPEFYTIYKTKGIATNALSIGTGTIVVAESLLRMPNIGMGLFNAIKQKDKSKITQLSLAVLGISIMCLSFYTLIVLQAVYNTKDTSSHAFDKNVAEMLSGIYGVLIICMGYFYYNGLRK